MAKAIDPTESRNGTGFIVTGLHKNTGVAAYLSQDKNMMEAYESECPYLFFR